MKDLFKKNGYKLGYIAEILGITPRALRYKLQDPGNRFNLDEASLIAKHTTITVVEMVDAATLENENPY